MADFNSPLIVAARGVLEKNKEHPELCSKVQALAKYSRESTDAKQFLADLKQVLRTKCTCEDDLVKFLVPLYLSVGNKNAGKKVLSSYFQSLASPLKEVAFKALCQEVQGSCDTVAMRDFTDQLAVRHVVDALAALMDNFPLGEECVTAVSSSALTFLARCQDYFFCLFRQDGYSAVQINSLMHDCHVTMQALNRFTQRHLLKGMEHLQDLANNVFPKILQMDIRIMVEEKMMIDCRCCCAINLVLLLQMSKPDQVPQVVKFVLGLESTTPSVPPWLEAVSLTSLSLSILTPMASLALLWGLLSMLSSSTITMETADVEAVDLGDKVDERSTVGDDKKEMEVAKDQASRGGGRKKLVCEVMLEKLLALDEICQTTASRVQCVKTVTLWATRILNCLKESGVLPNVHYRLRGKGEAIQQLLPFVWTHWQDQLDAMRQNSRIIFDKCLRIHVLASRCDDVTSDPFLQCTLGQVLPMLNLWGNLSKCSALVSLVQVMGCTPILRQNSQFPTTLLLQMSDQSIACHASELYEVAMRADREEMKTTSECDSQRDDYKRRWLAVWVDPVISLLCSPDKKLKLNIIEYILPKVMKEDKSVLEYMLTSLSSLEGRGREHLGALIVCLRRARAWGLMSEALQSQQGSGPVWMKIQAALSSPEEQIRLDAFALLCENKCTAEVVTHVEFRHLQYFITYNLNNQSPAFRQAVLSFIKKLFFRVNESQLALLRKRKKKQSEKETASALKNYTSFLTWLEGFLFAQLYPSAAFARRTMSLAILSRLVQDIQPDKEEQGYLPLGRAGVNHVHTLLECLSDTFEENKQEAYRLLLACTSGRTDLLTKERCARLYTTGIQLAVSTRPQDCGTAAYILRLLLHQPCVTDIMTSCRTTLTPASSHLASRSGTGDLTEGTASEKAADNAGDASGMKRVMKELESDGQNTGVSPTLRLLQILLVLLADQVNVAQSSLILAAANRPIYPTLHCIRYILDSTDLRSLKECEKLLWSRFINSLLQVCLQVAAVVSPVVQNSSPEGNIPEEAVLGPGLKFDLDLIAEVEESQRTVSLMPEYLVVCCWRSIKEVSLLLGQLCRSVPVSQPGVCQGLVSLTQIEEVGHYFKQQLMESLHRGAFELAYAGFVMMCQMLWKSPWSELQMLPRRWLEEMMAAIASPEKLLGLCATRRSAGVPFFIQAIVATETSACGRPSFHKAILQLMEMALSPVNPKHTASTDGQVHALNILRALFKDARLGEDVAPYLCDGLKAAILGFKSQFWEIRNSATLLLSALMTRIFGVKRSKDEAVLSKRNSQTGRAFFHKYPALYQFLLTELDMATQNLGTSGHLHLHPSLYPVLMVLGRLFPSTMEGTTTRLNLAAFIPYVIRCSSSPVYKTRVMAARALQPLAGMEQMTSVLTSLLDSLPDHTPTEETGLPQSHIHGILLQIHQILMLTADMNIGQLTRMSDICCIRWICRNWLMNRQNPCLCTRKVALDVTDLILSSLTPIKSLLPESDQSCLYGISCYFTDALECEVQFPAFSRHIPFLPEYLSCVTTLALKYLCQGEGTEAESVVQELLSFEIYEMHVAVLDFLLSCVGKAERSKGNDSQLPAEEVIPPTAQGDAAGAWRCGIDTATVFSPVVVGRLLDMGLREGSHAETAAKVFQLFSLLPPACVIGQRQTACRVFEMALSKLQNERSAEVKASLINFTGHLFPQVYNDLKKNKEDSNKLQQLSMVWVTVLTANCAVEQPDDLHLACAQVFSQNCVLLLTDEDRCLGPLVFDFWSLLVTLLQDDDLEVKDIAASASSKLLPCKSDGSHPEQALGQLISAMFSIHMGTDPFNCLATALSWLLPESSPSEGVKGDQERLFDKGELNTFQDSIFLAKLLSDSFNKLVNPASTENALQDANSWNITSFSDVDSHPSKGSQLSDHLCNYASDGNYEALVRVIQRAVGLVETKAAGSDFGTECEKSMFLKTSQYAGHTVFLIQLSLIVGSLRTVLESLPQPDCSLQVMLNKLEHHIQLQMNSFSSSHNFLLGLLTDIL